MLAADYRLVHLAELQSTLVVLMKDVTPVYSWVLHVMDTSKDSAKKNVNGRTRVNRFQEQGEMRSLIWEERKGKLEKK